MESLENNLNFCFDCHFSYVAHSCREKNEDLAGDNLIPNNENVILTRQVLICRRSEEIP